MFINSIYLLSSLPHCVHFLPHLLCFLFATICDKKCWRRQLTLLSWLIRLLGANKVQGCKFEFDFFWSCKVCYVFYVKYSPLLFIAQRHIVKCGADRWGRKLFAKESVWSAYWLWNIALIRVFILKNTFTSYISQPWGGKFFALMSTPLPILSKFVHISLST